MPHNPDLFKLENAPDAEALWARSMFESRVVVEFPDVQRARWMVFKLSLYRRAQEIQNMNGEPWMRSVRIKREGATVIMENPDVVSL